MWFIFIKAFRFKASGKASKRGKKRNKAFVIENGAKSNHPFALNSVVDTFPLTKIKLAPTWHFIIFSTEWFIVCGGKRTKERGKITFPAKAKAWSIFFSFFLLPLSKKKKKLLTNNNVSCNWSEVAGWACSKSALFKRQSAPRSSDAG